jgi:hypothetical protein
MSSHFIKKGEPPPGISSFTKIRLGWIASEQVSLVRPGETRRTLLAPLAKRGQTLAVKIPLQSGHYYLVENRQPIGFDRVLPDSGILILKVNPKAQEGSGTVQVMDADPDSPNFSHATFRPDRRDRNVFIDEGNNVAILALRIKGQSLEVLVTTPEKARIHLRRL